MNIETDPYDVIKVAADSKVPAVAGAIAGTMRDHRQAVVQAIGAAAVNQAVKSLAIARMYLIEDGIQIACIPEFTDVDISGKTRTAVKFLVSISEN